MFVAAVEKRKAFAMVGRYVDEHDNSMKSKSTERNAKNLFSMFRREGNIHRRRDSTMERKSDFRAYQVQANNKIGCRTDVFPTSDDFSVSCCKTTRLSMNNRTISDEASKRNSLVLTIRFLRQKARHVGVNRDKLSLLRLLPLQSINSKLN